MSKDFYHENFQERRCQIGLHNFPTYENKRDNGPVLCKRCGYMKLCYDPFDDEYLKDVEIVNTFKKIHFGHKND